jgi:hypothetical protein
MDLIWSTVLGGGWTEFGSNEHANYCEILGSHDGDYQVYDLLACVVM